MDLAYNYINYAEVFRNKKNKFIIKNYEYIYIVTRSHKAAGRY
jgi:hypothetical protein